MTDANKMLSQLEESTKMWWMKRWVKVCARCGQCESMQKKESCAIQSIFYSCIGQSSQSWCPLCQLKHC